jgi:hypothetical protein
MADATKGKPTLTQPATTQAPPPPLLPPQWIEKASTPIPKRT